MCKIYILELELASKLLMLNKRRFQKNAENKYLSKQFVKKYIMRGHNVNIYFSEKTYNKIKPLIEQRKVSEFVNKLVERELEKQQQKEREKLRKEMIEGYQDKIFARVWESLKLTMLKIYNYIFGKFVKNKLW